MHKIIKSSPKEALFIVTINSPTPGYMASIIATPKESADTPEDVEAEASEIVEFLVNWVRGDTCDLVRKKLNLWYEEFNWDG